MGAMLDRATLVDMMADMATGDSSVLPEFVQEFGDHLARSVGGVLKSMGRSDLGRQPADMEYLVWSAAIVVFDRAARWDPAGSLPWVWSHRAIRAEVVAWMGHSSVTFDPRTHSTADGDKGSKTTTADVTLRSLANRHEEVAHWIAAVDDVANERDRHVHVEYQTQKHLGDRSPARTVSTMFGLTPSNVRQIDTRVRRRLAAHPFGASTIASALIGPFQ